MRRHAGVSCGDCPGATNDNDIECYGVSSHASLRDPQWPGKNTSFTVELRVFPVDGVLAGGDFFSSLTESGQYPVGATSVLACSPQCEGTGERIKTLIFSVTGRILPPQALGVSRGCGAERYPRNLIRIMPA